MYFGTDGIRGRVDKDICSQLCYKVGKGLAIYMKKRGLNSVLIGKDNRISSDTYANAVITGLLDYGIDVVSIGIVSTPMVSYLVSQLGEYSLGIMITASHNDYKYNGIKIFDSDGYKLNKQEEKEVEKYINNNIKPKKLKGKLILNTEIKNKYIDYLLKTFSSLKFNCKIVVDCANGANAAIAPEVYKRLGAQVVPIGCNGNGLNINENCGANYVENLINQVLSSKADLGVAFDGDGDRLVVVDGEGNVVSGEEILYGIALVLQRENKLIKNSVVGTILTSKGLEETLKRNEINLIRVDVGDKNVIENMQKNNFKLGGESSGHICIFDYTKTCDGLLVSLYFIYKFLSGDIDISYLRSTIIKYPITKTNFYYDKNKINLKKHKVNIKIQEVVDQYKDATILVRPSGTEPCIRLSVESKTISNNRKILVKLLKIIKKYKQ